MASVQRYIRHICSSDQCPRVYQTLLRHWPVSSDISDTSGSDQCPTMYQSHFWQWPVSNITRVFGIGQCPAIYQTHPWQWPVSNHVSITFLAVASVQRCIRHISGIDQCPAIYQTHLLKWPLSSCISDTSLAAASVQRCISHISGNGKCPAVQPLWWVYSFCVASYSEHRRYGSLAAFMLLLPPRPWPSFHAVDLVVVDKVRRGTNSHVDVGI